MLFTKEQIEFIEKNLGRTLDGNVFKTNEITVPSNFRLGYACICTELRKKNIFCSRTARLATLKTKGLAYIRDLAMQNLRDLLTTLRWNVAHDIFFMRISSDIFPFAGHLEHGYPIDFAADLLVEIGEYARSNGIRITMHPGQYNVLSSPHANVVKATVSDLSHQCEILDLMRMGIDSVMIIHGGGVYGNKPEALSRLEKNILALPTNVRNRLVLENCEMAYCVEDLLQLSERILMPIVIDFHHDDIYPSTLPVEKYLDRVFAVWQSRGIKPKVHVSNSVPGLGPDASKTARRKHSDYIYFLHEALLSISFPIDVMFEAKAKEQAIFRLTNKN